MILRVRGIPTEAVERLRAGGSDANGQPPLQRCAEGRSNPCRHCLQLIDEGAPMLVLAYRPFERAQPYAETGPIFLHAEPCAQYDRDVLPPWFDYLQPALLRGYGADDWIRYDTAQVLPGPQLQRECERLLAGTDVRYLHIRSKFNCFQCRVERATTG